MCKRNIEARSRNHCCHGKAISVTYSECLSIDLVIQHAKRMRRIMLSSEACPAVPYFSTLSHKRHDFRKKGIEHKMCVLIFSTNLFQTFLITRRMKRYIIINVHRSSFRVPVILVRFYWKLNFLDRSSRNTQIYQIS